MAETQVFIPTHSIFGLGSISRLGPMAAESGIRALVVAESVLDDYGIIDRIKEVLRASGIRSLIFSEISSSATSTAVDQAVALAKSSQTQMVIGLGGVHALSIAKCVAKTAGSGQSIDALLSGEPCREGTLPYIEVPTTCRNPFQCTDKAFLIDGRSRTGTVITLGMYPAAAIMDPDLTLSLSPKFTATTLIDTLLLAIEGFISKKSSFFSDAAFLQVCKPLLFLMKSAVLEPKNIDHRTRGAQFGFMTALGLSASSYGLGSAIALVLGGRFSLPHSWIASILLPHIISWANTVVPDRIHQLVNTVQEDKLGSPLKTSEDFINFARYTVASLRLPMRLHALGVDLAKLTSSIPNIRDLGGTAYLPVAVTEEDIYNLLESAY